MPLQLEDNQKRQQLGVDEKLEAHGSPRLVSSSARLGSTRFLNEPNRAYILARQISEPSRASSRAARELNELWKTENK